MKFAYKIILLFSLIFWLDVPDLILLRRFVSVSFVKLHGEPGLRLSLHPHHNRRVTSPRNRHQTCVLMKIKLITLIIPFVKHEDGNYTSIEHLRG